MYCGWPWRQNPASASRHLGHPSQYLFPVPWDLRTSGSTSVVILCILVHVLRPHGRSFRPGQPALQLTRARSMSPAAGDGQQERGAGRPREAGNGCVPALGRSGGDPALTTGQRAKFGRQCGERDRYRCRLSSGISSLASSGPLYLVFTGATQQRGSPAVVPQPRRLPWAYCGVMTTWSVAGGTSPRASLSM